MNLYRLATTELSSDVRNRIIEATELEGLRAGADRAFLYVKVVDNRWTIGTWLGTLVTADVTMGRRVYGGFGSFRRSVSCRIYGRRYVGWYYESSGDYCRLKKAKRQN